VNVQIPVAGSYSSALALGSLGASPATDPPATKTKPDGSNVAVCANRGVFMLPVLLQVPVAGS
jgi:hypothetical protein